jgi:methylenetetrahydrofolate dehydrogenase (NADP+) / methenyltetrahydrofolate cyclohydrolase
MTVKTKPIEEKIKDEIVKEVIAINDGRVGDALLRPNLAILVIGKVASSLDFVAGLEKEAVKIGVDTHTYKCPAESDAEEIGAMIECLNDDDLIDGIYLQLPLPEDFDQEEILALIKPDKELNYLLDIEDEAASLKEAKLFKGVLENYKKKTDLSL